jgi:hypothetical protein
MSTNRTPIVSTLITLLCIPRTESNEVILVNDLDVQSPRIPKNGSRQGDYLRTAVCIVGECQCPALPAYDCGRVRNAHSAIASRWHSTDVGHGAPVSPSGNLNIPILELVDSLAPLLSQPTSPTQLSGFTTHFAPMTGRSRCLHE